MWVLNLIVGSKMGRIAALVLGVTLISSLTIQYIQSVERGKVELEIENQRLQKYIDTRRRIQDVQDNPTANSDDADNFLRDRQGR